MLVESNFPNDVRVRREAHFLKDYGHEVSVIAIKEDGHAFFEIVEAINVYRVPKIELFKTGKHLPSKKSRFMRKSLILIKAICGYSFEYLYFTFACFFMSLLIRFKHKFDVIHTHNPPDTLFLVALFHKVLFGSKFIYDHHDLSPDLFLEKYSKKGKSIHKLLLFLEKFSCKSADLVIATNESYKKIEIERCCVRAEDVYVVRYGPDLNEMKIAEPIEFIQSEGKTVLCYLGEINIQDGVDYLLVSLARIIYEYNMRDILLLIIGDGDYMPKIKELANELEIDKYILFTGYIYDRDLLNKYLSTADIFADAAPNSFLNESSTFIKLMEYMVFGKPTICFTLKESMYSLKDAGAFVPANNTEEFAKSVIDLINDEDKRRKLGENAKKRIKKLSWEKVSIPLINAYERLAA